MNQAQNSTVPAFVRAVRALNRYMAWLAGAGIAILMLPTVADVAYRKIFGPSIDGIIEYSEVGLVLVAFLGMAATMQRGAHINTPVLTNRLPSGVARAMRVTGHILVCLLLAVMVYGTVLDAVDSIRVGEYRFGLIQVPLWPAKVAIPIGLAAMLVELCIQVAEQFGMVRRTADSNHGSSHEH